MFLLVLLHQLLLLYSSDAQSKEFKDRLILKGNTPCEGHLEVFHNGDWRYVGDNRWNSSTEKVVCRSTHCGEPLSVHQMLMPGNGTVWLNEMKCSGEEQQLWECPHPGWGVSKFNKDTMRSIKCSNKIEIKLNGFGCDGVVQYTISPANKLGYFCDDNFGKEEADFLCKKLGCGESSKVYQMDWPKEGHFDKMAIECSDLDHLNDLWQCASQSSQKSGKCLKRAAVTCTGHQRVQLVGNSDNVCSGKLQIKNTTNSAWSPVVSVETISPDLACMQMHCGTSANYSLESGDMQLNCTDHVAVALSGTCSGQVSISVNNTSHFVCGSHWIKENAEVVCRELKCGRAVISENTSSRGNKGILDNVECSGNEFSLWHCRAKGKNNTCTHLVQVTCADSVGVKLVDGPGRCAGRLEIQLGDESFRVAKSEAIKTSLPRVCHLLGCGNSVRAVKETFSPGSGEFFKWAVNCGAEAKSISDCIEPSTIKSAGTTEALMLACEEYTRVSISGNKSCTGQVTIEHGDKTYRLSGSNSTWNWDSANAVCRQMHCGQASNYTSMQRTVNDIWKQSYNCTSNATSLFNCDNVMLADDHSNSTAHVTCTGSIKVDLTEDCWGHVNVCVEGKCGGVRIDTWSKEKSDTLCQNLGCGTTITSTESPNGKSAVIVESLHTNANANLNLSILVLSQIQPKSHQPNHRSAYVVCSASLGSNISDTRYKCSGNIQVEFEGQWLPVCKDAIKDDKETQDTICSQMKCGNAAKLLDHFGPSSSSTLVISKLQWPSSIYKTSTVTKSYSGCALAGIQCSEWRKMEVKFNRSCSGDVFLYSEGQRQPVSADGWMEDEGRRLCSDLQCNSFVSVTKKNSTMDALNSRISCQGVNGTGSIWDCENKEVAAVRGQQDQLVIECGGEPTVTLSEHCHGLVKINDLSVCSDDRAFEHAHIACMEQDCGNAVLVNDVSADRNPDGLLIRCESYHDQLGKCSRKQGQCKKGLMYIHCAESITLKTKDQCRGPLFVSNQNKWEDVCVKDLQSESVGELCRQLSCRGSSKSTIKTSYSKVTPQVMLNCTPEHKDMRYCVSQGTCGTKNVMAIQCEEYVAPPDETGIGQIVLYALIPVVLLLLILLMWFYVTRRSKKHRRNPAVRPLPRAEDDLDSDDEDHGKSKMWKTEAFSHDRFASDVESRAEGDAHSSSSFPYDDVEEAKPFTLPGATDDAPEDAVTYEVDDPQYGYDDVEVPTAAVTQADVHRAAGGAREESTEDYLVPGQDN